MFVRSFESQKQIVRVRLPKGKQVGVYSKFNKMEFDPTVGNTVSELTPRVGIAICSQQNTNCHITKVLTWSYLGASKGPQDSQNNDIQFSDDRRSSNEVFAK